MDLRRGAPVARLAMERTRSRTMRSVEPGSRSCSDGMRVAPHPKSKRPVRSLRTRVAPLRWTLESGGPEGDAALKRESLHQPAEAKKAKSSDQGEAESGGQPRGSEASGSGTIRPGSDVGSGPNRPDKKLKTPEPRGEKRAAPITWQEAVEKDLKLIDLIKAAPEPEIIGAMPTLHDTPVIAGYPETGTLVDAYDERTGKPLPLDKVERARGRELDKMLEHNLKTDITWEHTKKLGLKIVKSRWVDGWKFLPDDPNGVRSRCVAQEMNTHNRDDVFSGTSPLKAHRMVCERCGNSKERAIEQT